MPAHFPLRSSLDEYFLTEFSKQLYEINNQLGNWGLDREPVQGQVVSKWSLWIQI